MRNSLLISAIICINLYGIKLSAQIDSTLSNAIYATTYGVKNDKPLVDNIEFVIKSEGENYIEIEKFIDDTGNRFRDITKIWMVRYNGDYYYPLWSSGGLEKQFIKINKRDIDKQYLMYSIELKPLKGESEVLNHPATSIVFAVVSIVASGGTGIFIFVPVKEFRWEKYWVKENEKWGYIYFVDTKESLVPRAKILTKRRLKKLYPKNKELHRRIKDKEVSFEEAISLLEKLNN